MTDSDPKPVFSTRARPYNPPWLKNSALVVAVASIVVIAVALLRGPKVPEESGSVKATARETVTLSTRGVAVAEPGAAFDWRVVGAGKATIEQTAGSVFYRVDGPAPFVVRTTAGDLTAHGTCFSVAIGADGVALTVYEGRVAIVHEASRREVAAGETVLLQSLQ